jgi:thiol-disulfide isomerase/thioredoxin
MSESTSTGSTLSALALVLALLAGVAGMSRIFRSSGAAGAGKEAPDFTLPVVANAAELGADTSNVHLKDLRGHPVLLDFWATWCGPCRAEAPIIDRVSRRWKDRGVVVVGVNTDLPDQGDPTAFARAHGLSYPIARDEAGVAQRAYDVDSLPTLVVVSRTGKIVAVRSGITDDGELERLISQAM